MTGDEVNRSLARLLRSRFATGPLIGLHFRTQIMNRWALPTRQTQEKTVALGNMFSFDERAQNNRAGARVNSRVPVAVEWAESGRALRAEGYTKDASRKGCLAVIPQGFPVGQRLLLINLTNNNACQAVLIWRGHEGRAGWELGLELQEASMDFWGLDF